MSIAVIAMAVRAAALLVFVASAAQWVRVTLALRELLPNERSWSGFFSGWTHLLFLSSADERVTSLQKAGRFAAFVFFLSLVIFSNTSKVLGLFLSDS